MKLPIKLTSLTKIEDAEENIILTMKTTGQSVIDPEANWFKDANFIVTACNLHSELIEALKEAKKEIEACYKRLQWGVENKTNVMTNIETALNKAQS